MFRNLICLWFMFGMCCIAGCGNSNEILVNGKLLQKGEPYKPAPGEQVMISFVQQSSGGGEIYPTRLNSDGTFKIIGANEKGIPPGKYKVSISSNPEVPTPGQPTEDKFQGLYSVEKSPLNVEVSSSHRTIQLEIQ